MNTKWIQSLLGRLRLDEAWSLFPSIDKFDGWKLRFLFLLGEYLGRKTSEMEGRGRLSEELLPHILQVLIFCRWVMQSGPANDGFGRRRFDWFSCFPFKDSSTCRCQSMPNARKINSKLLNAIMWVVIWPWLLFLLEYIYIALHCIFQSYMHAVQVQEPELFLSFRHFPSFLCTVTVNPSCLKLHNLANKWTSASQYHQRNSG